MSTIDTNRQFAPIAPQIPVLRRMPAHHQTSEREALGPRVRTGATYGAIAGGLGGGVLGAIGAAMALGASTEGLAAGVTVRSRIPLALKHLAAWPLGAALVGAGFGAAAYGAYALMRAGNERFHL